jgi:L-lactate dehydrogenase complex protein LldF
VTRAAIAGFGFLGHGRGVVGWLPFAGGWTKTRDLPKPEPGGTFMSRYVKGRR